MDVYLSASIDLSKVNILIALFFCLCWLVIGKPLRLYYQSSVRFSAANGFFALSLVLGAQQFTFPVTNLWVIADLTLLITLVMYNLALRHLLVLPLDPRWIRVLMIGAAGVAALHLLGQISANLTSVTLLLLALFILISTTWMKFRALASAFNYSNAAILSIPDISLVLIIGMKSAMWLLYQREVITAIPLSSKSSPILMWIYIVLIILINVTAVGTAVSRLIIRMKHLADHDQLTGLLNRRAFEAKLADYFGLYQRYNMPFSIIMLDIDHFKLINDKYGHAAGDNAIVNTARVFRQTVRQTDVIARFGGEEFIILLPGQTASEANEVANKICLAIRTSQWQINTPALTISAGCADVTMVNSQDRLLTLADNALYEAKRNGRDQSIIATPDHPIPTATAN
ncbi:GGDEF domain-containing protein [Alteromonas sp. AMM-1]|uniref:GGDEF domain-containing protein n=1 Tax=Alteromonas sp. AMM-1 TaxID=3394233 RepID=UPI0039A732DB